MFWSKKIKYIQTRGQKTRTQFEQNHTTVLERIKWHIITSENVEEVFKKLEEQGIDTVLFGLTDKDFQLIAKNFAQISNQLKVTNELLDKYKEYYRT